MFARALIAFLLLPGMVAFALPAAWILGHDNVRFVQPFGLVPLATGAVALLWCVRDFHIVGRGTLAPWSPPERLVRVGLYRYSRNPMYVAVGLVLLGWAVSFHSSGLLAYAVVVVLAFHFRIVLGEEPWMARTFASEWRQYAETVPRWLW